MKDELFTPGQALYGQPFLIRKVSVASIYDFAEHRHLRFGFGAVVSRYSIPAALSPAYGSEPTGYSLFVRAKLIPQP